MKRVICFVLVIAFVLCGMPIANAVDEKCIIYFDTNGWKNTNKVQCYIGEVGGTQFGFLNGKREQGSLFSFELNKYNDFDLLNLDFQNGKNLIVMFLSDDGSRTCDITIGKSCVGDTINLTGKTVKNPLDASKTLYDATWKINNAKYGSHFTIAKYGDVIGSFLCPNESAPDVIGDWLAYYYNDFEVDAAADVVSNAMTTLKYYNTDEIYKRVYKTQGSVNPLIDLILYKAEYNTCGVITLDQEKATLYIGETYKIPITKGGNYKSITFKSKNSKVATATNSGKVTAKKAGAAVIEIKTPYRTKKFTVTVKKPYIKLSKKSLLMTVREKAKLKYKAMPKKNIKVSWKSSKPKIVTVSSKGKVKAKKQGKAYITATMKYKGKSYKSKCQVISLKL